jgi:hypothetical protein
MFSWPHFVLSLLVFLLEGGEPTGAPRVLSCQIIHMSWLLGVLLLPESCPVVGFVCSTVVVLCHRALLRGVWTEWLSESPPE